MGVVFVGSNILSFIRLSFEVRTSRFISKLYFLTVYELWKSYFSPQSFNYKTGIISPISLSYPEDWFMLQIKSMTNYVWINISICFLCAHVTFIHLCWPSPLEYTWSQRKEGKYSNLDQKLAIFFL